MPTALLNGVAALAVRIVTPERGAWVAEVDLDPIVAAAFPFSVPAPAVLLIGTAITLRGTIDPRGSGRFVSTVRVRIVGGGGGWDKPVTQQDYQNDAGVLSTLVYTAAGAEVGEAVVDALPSVLGFHFVRVAGPASAVFRDRHWYVDSLGVTQVSPRIFAVPDPSLEILSWEPTTQRAEVASDALLLPGTPLVDPRIGGTPVVVRDVEQTFTRSGSRAVAWCSASSVSRLASALINMVRQFGQTAYLKPYRYRFVLAAPGLPGEVGDRLQLQAVHPNMGAPDVLPISVWGPSGISAKLTPSTEVLVHFIEGDPGQPVVLGISPAGLPLELDLDASVAVSIGHTAPIVELAGGAAPLATAPWAVALQAALVVFATGVNPGNLAAKGALLLTALGLLPSPSTTKVTAT